MRWLERRIILDVVDSQWKDHLLSLDHLKEGIGLRGYGQKDPLVEFKKEAFILFEDMMARIDNETIRYLFHVQMQQDEQPRSRERASLSLPQQPRPLARRSRLRRAPRRVPRKRLRSVCRILRAKWSASRSASNTICSIRPAPAQAEAPKPVRAGAKVGRNDPCPCGSGKKYKKCHGANA